MPLLIFASLATFSSIDHWCFFKYYFHTAVNRRANSGVPPVHSITDSSLRENQGSAARAPIIPLPPMQISAPLSSAVFSVSSFVIILLLHILLYSMRDDASKSDNATIPVSSDTLYSISPSLILSSKSLIAP